MRLNKPLAVTLLVAIFSAGCTPNISPNSDQAMNANQVQNAFRGVVVSMRNIAVQGDDNKVGALAGTVAGAAGGSAIGGGTRMNIIGAVGGAVLGGIAGDYAQKKLSNQVGIEYVIKTKTGQLKSVVQSGDNTAGIHVGTHVIVIMGPHARVIPDNG